MAAATGTASVSYRKMSVRQLLEEVAKERYAIPELQREFVWNRARISKLLDSIIRGYPIGSLLFWSADRSYADQIRSRSKTLPAVHDRNPKIMFILDGQQRLTTLWQLSKGNYIEGIDRRPLDFSDFVYTFSPHPKSETNFEYRRRKTEHADVSLTALLSDSWDKRIQHFSTRKRRHLASVRKAILNYQIPTTTLRASRLEDVRETFLRINSQGMTISKADDAFARATRFSLRHKITGIRADLPHGFSAVQARAILLGLALTFEKYNIGSQVNQALVRRLESRQTKLTEIKTRLTRLHKAYQVAADYLHGHLGVANRQYLPSDNVLTMLAIFYFYNRNRPPSPEQQRQIRRWFWATALFQRYSGNKLRNSIRYDARFFKRLGAGTNAVFHHNERIRPEVLAQQSYRRRTSLTAAYFCLLHVGRPRHFENGTEIRPLEHSSKLNRSNEHHVFPSSRIKKLGPSVYNSILNICILTGADNRRYSKSLPRVYLEEVKHFRHFRKSLRSHLLPDSSRSALWGGANKTTMKAFFDERLPLICKAFEKQAGLRVFRRVKAATKGGRARGWTE